MENFDLYVALEKLNEEMSVEHTPSEDIIHNYLCEEMETSPELVQGVLKTNRSIKGAMDYCSTKAHKMAVNNVAMVDDSTVFAWIQEYFLSDEIDVEKPSVKAKVIASKTKVPTTQNRDLKPKATSKASHQEEVVDGQLSLF